MEIYIIPFLTNLYSTHAYITVWQDSSIIIATNIHLLDRRSNKGSFIPLSPMGSQDDTWNRGCNLLQPPFFFPLLEIINPLLVSFHVYILTLYSL